MNRSLIVLYLLSGLILLTGCYSPPEYTIIRSCKPPIFQKFHYTVVRKEDDGSLWLAYNGYVTKFRVRTDTIDDVCKMM